jgi:hypothetical protein
MSPSRMLPSLGAKSFGVQRRVRGDGQKPDIVRKPDFRHLQNQKYLKKQHNLCLVTPNLREADIKRSFG